VWLVVKLCPLFFLARYNEHRPFGEKYDKDVYPYKEMD
jgi:hypothetical protein